MTETGNAAPRQRQADGEAHFLYEHRGHLDPPTGLLCGKRPLSQPRTYKTPRGFYTCSVNQQCAECRRILDLVIRNDEYQTLARWRVPQALQALRSLLSRVGYSEQKYDCHLLVPVHHMHQAITNLQGVLCEFEAMWRPIIDLEAVGQEQGPRFAFPKLRESAL